MRADLNQIPYRDFAYPRLTSSPPAGGEWTPSPETFFVEEIPLYPFQGEGEHVALRVEKRGRTTREIAVTVSERLGLPVAAVGYAGMKDKACVSIQSFTLLGVPEKEAAQAFCAEGCRVLGATRHTNKLRLGHLAGNRFRIFLGATSPAAARTALADLERRGAPNYFGPQRFGAKGDNALRGMEVLIGRRKTGRWKRDLLVSALQAFVFNELAARRVEQGTLTTALGGDVLRKEASGGLFVCSDPAEGAERVAAFEVSPTGPMHGKKMVRPAGEVARAEEAVLIELGLQEALFVRETGSRRPLRSRVAGWSVAEAPQGTWLEFSLPAGAFATAVVREITG